MYPHLGAGMLSGCWYRWWVMVNSKFIPFGWAKWQYNGKWENLPPTYGSRLSSIRFASPGHGGFLPMVLSWLWWPPDYDGLLAMVASWLWWIPGWPPGYGGILPTMVISMLQWLSPCCSPDCGGLLAVMVSWLWWSPSYGILLAMTGHETQGTNHKARTTRQVYLVVQYMTNNFTCCYEIAIIEY